jgi:hypothetical protein
MAHSLTRSEIKQNKRMIVGERNYIFHHKGSLPFTVTAASHFVNAEFIRLTPQDLQYNGRP